MTLSGTCATTAYDSVSRFTGKERDTESGNDYFEARYYSSSMGRFMSPDWSAKEEPIPYAKLDDPQSLNLYAYVMNNPLSRTDPTGHWCLLGHGSSCSQPPPPPLPLPPPATIAATTKTGVVAVFHQDSGKIATLDAAGNTKELGRGTAGEGFGANNPLAQDRKDADYPKGNAGPLPRGEYTIGPLQDNPVHHGQKVLKESMRLSDSPNNNMGRRDHNSFLIHAYGKSEGCIMTTAETRRAISTSGTNTLEVER